MKHLSDVELSAHLDRALNARAEERAERHLAACERCREALAALASQDASLRPALSHDPGEAYFESLPGRVEERIRAAGLAGAQSRGQGLGLGQLFRSPRALAWAGAVAAVVGGAGLALMTGREVRPPDLRDRDLVERSQPAEPGLGSPERPERARPGGDETPPGTLAEGERAKTSGGERALGGPAIAERGQQTEAGRRAAASSPAASSMTADAARQPRTSTPAAPLVAKPASPGRAYEVRRNEAGEDVPVGRVGALAPTPAPGVATITSSEAPRKKLAAEPLKESKSALDARALDAARPKEEATGDYLFAQPLADRWITASPAPATRQGVALDGAGSNEARLCGAVRDAAGRPIAGAQVSLTDLGRTAATDARGAFCLVAPVGEHPLTVMAVGFAESRQDVRVGGEASEVRVTLRAVPVLERDLAATTPGGAARSASGQAIPDSLLDAMRAARRLESTAIARRSAALFDAAAAAWDRALQRSMGGPLELEARRHLAETRYRAWETGPNDRRAAAAVEALTAYVGRAPASPERDQAMRWLERTRR
jgi:hypothetical protein